MNEVEKKANTAMTLADRGGGVEDILAQNIVVPRILLMQALSDLVTDGKAQTGDFIRSTTGEKIGNADTPIPFIPLTFTNTWVLSEKVGNKYEYRKTEPRNAANQDLPWEFTENGAAWKRTQSLNLFALLMRDVEAETLELEKAKRGEMPDPDKALMPVSISFRSTSFAAGGRSITTHFAKARKFNLPGFVSVLNLTCKKTKNDKGVFFVMDAANAGKTPPSVISTCEYWYNTLASKSVIVDSEGDDETATGAVGSQSSF